MDVGIILTKRVGQTTVGLRTGRVGVGKESV